MEKGEVDERIEAEIDYEALEDTIEGMKRFTTFLNFFTTIIILGFTFNSMTFRSLTTHKHCTVGSELAKDTILCQLLCFGFFSLAVSFINSTRVMIAMMKREKDKKKHPLHSIKTRLLLIMVASIIGQILLITALVLVYRLKTGKLACQEWYAISGLVLVCLLLLAAFGEITYALFLTFSSGLACGVSSGLGRIGGG